jgi:hypothetical protein
MNYTRRHLQNAYQIVQDIVGCLYIGRVGVNEHGAQEVNLLNDIIFLADPNSVANIVRMLEEQKDDTPQDFLHARANKPA